MKKLLALFILALFVVPISTFTIPPSTAKKEQVPVEIFDFTTNKRIKKEMSYEEAEMLENDLMEGNPEKLGIRFDLGFSNYLLSYGNGDVYIPLKKERSFLRFMLRPIIFNYERGFTFVKFGANYFWKGQSIGDYGFMVKKQCGIMLGFYGLHIKIDWVLRPDTHIFAGGSLLVTGYNKLL